MLVLGTDSNDFSHFLFHGLQAFAKRPIQGAHHSFNPVLIITILPGFMPFDMHDDACSHSPKSLETGLRCRTYIASSGILTAFPFFVTPIRRRIRTD